MGFRSLDFFKKVNQDIDSSSVSGGIYTLIAFALGIFLFITELNAFL